MATEEKVHELSITANRLKSDALDEQKLVRRTLGEESLEKAIMPLLDEIRHKANFSVRYAENVPEGYVEQVRQQLEYIANECEVQAGRSNHDFIANKDAFLSNIRNSCENLKDPWVYFVSAAVEARGLLSDEDIQTRYAETVREMKEQSRSLLDELEARSADAINEARKLASDIEARARKTAEKISVAEAQRQFKKAQTPLLVLLGFWGVLSIASFIGFFWLLSMFMNVELTTEWTSQIIYVLGLRFAALGAVASLGAYCLSILRSQLHLFQRNLHRQRIANCVEAFVQSASTPEQRDFIYSQLVEAIIKYGDTGLVKGRVEEQPTTKLLIDGLPRSTNPTPTD